MTTNRSNRNIQHTQKVGFSLLLLFSICVVVLGVYQFRTTIYGPFVFKPVQRDAELEAINLLFEDESVRLQTIDTDQDGLNDFEELYFYNTSPYLPDTDSDGIDDKTEIEQGTDPVCPANKDCELYNPEAQEEDNTTTTLTSPLLDVTLDNTSDILGITGELSTEEDLITTETTTVYADMLSLDSQEIVDLIMSDPEAIRELLRQNTDLSDEEIDAFSDELLLKTITELIAE